MSLPASDPVALDAARFFAALGDATRLALVAKLCDGDRSIVQLSEGTGITRQGVTKHLAILQRADIVASRRSGREQRFALKPEALDAARDYLDRAARQWDDAVGRLRRLVED